VASLLDIAAGCSETVSVGSKSVTVNGLGIRELAGLFRRFPALGAALSGQKSDEAVDLWALGPEFVAAVLAAATGYAGDVEHEAAAARLPAPVQVELFAAVVRLTLPEGLENFLGRIADLAQTLGVNQAS
jgi:hypothetical protein